MPNTLLVINFKMVKDKHNVILILVSPKILIPYSWGSSNSRFHLFHLLFFPEFQALIITEIHLKHYKVSPCFFNFSFFSLSFFLPEFFMKVLHDGSSRIYISFSKCSSRFFSMKLKFSSCCNPELNSFFRIIGGGIMPFLIIWIHVSWFTCC